MLMEMKANEKSNAISDSFCQNVYGVWKTDTIIKMQSTKKVPDAISDRFTVIIQTIST